MIKSQKDLEQGQSLPPVMAMIDYPAEPTRGRFYVLLPAPPNRVLPAIRLAHNRLIPCYISITEEEDDGMIFSVGCEKVIGKLTELQGIQAALQLMERVWQGVLKSNESLDRAKVERLAHDLAKRPESSRALILQSGVKGIGPKFADDYFRNVVALCYLKFIKGLRKSPKDKEYNEWSPRGGLAWNGSAREMNLLCDAIYPRAEGWQWCDFDKTSLKNLIDKQG